MEEFKAKITVEQIETINQLLPSDQPKLKPSPATVCRCGPTLSEASWNHSSNPIKVEYDDGSCCRVYRIKMPVDIPNPHRLICNGSKVALVFSKELNLELFSHIRRTKAKAEIKAIRDKWSKLGWASTWCESCGSFKFDCRDCGSNACGSGTKDCSGCQVAYRYTKALWDEIDDLMEVAFNG